MKRKEFWIVGKNVFTNEEDGRYFSNALATEMEHVVEYAAYDEIIEYCRPHWKQMWAAQILGIVFGCDFRDVKGKLDEV